jgi:hypothetical protein
MIEEMRLPFDSPGKFSMVLMVALLTLGLFQKPMLLRHCKRDANREHSKAGYGMDCLRAVIVCQNATAFVAMTLVAAEAKAQSHQEDSSELTTPLEPLRPNGADLKIVFPNNIERLLVPISIGNPIHFSLEALHEYLKFKMELWS